MSNNYIKSWIRALRPAQWMKNGVVMAAWFFARWDPGEQLHTAGLKPLLLTIGALLCFCIVSSGIYILNDIHDMAADQLHPRKRFRPLAAGEIKPLHAWFVAVILLIIGTGFSLWLAPGLGYVAGVYIVLQMLYTRFLKQIPYLDVFIIATGFVLRAIAGTAVLTVRISPWLLLCTFLLALFLALCKRRHEKTILDKSETIAHREALTGYSHRLLDMQIVVTATAALVCYSIYTLSEDTIARFGTPYLGVTIPFAFFGIFRYLDLVYNHDAGGEPEQVLLNDKILIITIVCYLVVALLIFVTA